MTRARHSQSHAVPPELFRGLVSLNPGDRDTFLALDTPVRMVGRGPGCDVRIREMAVRPLHCLLVPSPTNLFVRSLQADGVIVNGQPKTACELESGDVLKVGSHSWRVVWPIEKPADDANLQTLRIQAAAVAALQTAVLDQESRIEARSEALIRQESQLAHRLETDRRNLLDLQNQIADARRSLRDKRAALVQIANEHERQIEERQDAIDSQQKTVAAREARLIKLWRLWKRRIRRQQIAQQRQSERMTEKLNRREADLAARQEQFDEQRRGFHTQVEIDRRHLDATRVEIAEKERELAIGRLNLQQQFRQLGRRTKELAAKENRLSRACAADRARRQELQAELHNLDERSKRSRDQLARLQADVGGLERALVQKEPQQPLSSPAPNVQHLAERLTDRRMHLLELIRRFVDVQSEWESHRSQAVLELEALVNVQSSHAKQLCERELELCDGEAQLEADRGALKNVMARLEADRLSTCAQIASERFALSRDREQLEARERLIVRREQSLCGLYRVWGHRRTLELKALHHEAAAHAAAREHWAELRDTWLRARIRLARERHDLAAQSFALERYRSELIESAENPELAKRRLERLQRQWAVWCQHHARELERLAASLTRESQSLDGRTAQATQRERSIQNQAQYVCSAQAELERERAILANSLTAHQVREAAWNRLKVDYEQQIARMLLTLDQYASVFVDTLPERAKAA